MEGRKPEIVPIERALEEARESALDLVEISPNQDPPVVKIIDYSRFIFDQKKRSKESKKKQKIVHLKEIKLRPAIADNDYEHKIRQVIEFINKGDKVKFTIRFRGREIVHDDLGFKLLERVKKDLEDLVQIEQNPTKEGRALSMIVAPSTVKSKKNI